MNAKLELIKKCDKYFQDTFCQKPFNVDENTSDEQFNDALSLILSDWEGFELLANEIKNIL
jgi:hypothetical protein